MIWNENIVNNKVVETIEYTTFILVISISDFFK